MAHRLSLCRGFESEARFLRRASRVEVATTLSFTPAPLYTSNDIAQHACHSGTTD